MNTKAKQANPWQPLDVNAIPKDCAIQIAVYSTGSYTSIQGAENSGGIYIARETVHGRAMAEQCIDGINAAQECMDGAMPLVIIYRHV